MNKIYEIVMEIKDIIRFIFYDKNKTKYRCASQYFLTFYTTEYVYPTMTHTLDSPQRPGWTKTANVYKPPGTEQSRHLNQKYQAHQNLSND